MVFGHDDSEDWRSVTAATIIPRASSEHVDIRDGDVHMLGMEKFEWNSELASLHAGGMVKQKPTAGQGGNQLKLGSAFPRNCLIWIAIANLGMPVYLEEDMLRKWDSQRENRYEFVGM